MSREGNMLCQTACMCHDRPCRLVFRVLGGKGLGVHIHALPALSTLSQSSARQFRLFKHVLKFKGCSFNRLLECSHFVVVPGFVLVILGGKSRDNRLRRYRPAIFVLLFAGLRVALFVCV